MGLGLLLGVGFALYRQWWRPYRARVWRKRAIAEACVDVLFSVILPDGQDGWFHLDALMLTESGIIVLDIRDWEGLIYGSEAMQEWTVMHSKGRHTIPNPLSALYDRIAVIRGLVGEGIAVEGRVLFGAQAQYPKGRPHWVSVLGELSEEFKAKDPEVGLSFESAGSTQESAIEAFGRLKQLATPSPHRVI
jgi:hypothetical protein